MSKIETFILRAFEALARPTKTFFSCLQCSVQCGGGTKTRTVSCETTFRDQKISLHEAECMAEEVDKPATTEQCNTMDCYIWAHDHSCDECRGIKKY